MPPRQGWQCPICGAVNAPWMAQCLCGGQQRKVTWVTGTSTGDVSPAPPSYTTCASQVEENCETCAGGCDLCYYCENGNHWKYRGQVFSMEKKNG